MQQTEREHFRRENEKRISKIETKIKACKMQQDKPHMENRR